jgi:hypothetical protein
MKKLIQIIRILIEDKRKGKEGRTDRVTAINELLGGTKSAYTPELETGNRKWIVEYKRPQFWYDNRPITLTETIRCFSSWHVRLWKLIGDKGSMVGFTNTMVGGFGKREIYKFLNVEARRHNAIFDRADERERAKHSQPEETENAHAKE